jgi:ribosomal-protein-alanine N-acetyltransferase
VRAAPIWPVTLECGDLVLRPIRYRDKKEWTEVRGRNSEWLAPWEASNPAPGGGLPDYRQMVR